MAEQAAHDGAAWALAKIVGKVAAIAAAGGFGYGIVTTTLEQKADTAQVSVLDERVNGIETRVIDHIELLREDVKRVERKVDEMKDEGAE